MHHLVVDTQILVKERIEVDADEIVAVREEEGKLDVYGLIDEALKTIEKIEL